jgi:hypothetical protein
MKCGSGICQQSLYKSKDRSKRLTKRKLRGEKPKEGWEMGKKMGKKLEGGKTNREGRQVVVPPVLAGRRW